VIKYDHCSAIVIRSPDDSDDTFLVFPKSPEARDLPLSFSLSLSLSLPLSLSLSLSLSISLCLLYGINFKHRAASRNCGHARKGKDERSDLLDQRIGGSLESQDRRGITSILRSFFFP